MAGETTPRLRETVVQGVSWTSMVQAVVENARGEDPVLRFDEERVLDFGNGNEVRRRDSSLTVPYVRDKIINIRDQDTGLPTGGTMTYRRLFLAIYSAYMDAADERDAAPSQPPGA